MLAESSNTVSFRATHLEKKRSNRREDMKPKVPEIYLDESYVNMHHTASKAWQTGAGDRCAPSGRGKRIVMVGAGVVYNNKGRLTGK
jgi:hypothetical protein